MIHGGHRKTSSRSLVGVGIQRDVILMPGILEIFLSESPYPSNSLQLRHPLRLFDQTGKNCKAFNLSCTRVENGVRRWNGSKSTAVTIVVSQTLVENLTL
jgi:hypothetical protein